MRQTQNLNQTGKMLESLEAKLRYQWKLVNGSQSQDELRQRRAQALETYRQLKKFKIMIGAA